MRAKPFLLLISGAMIGGLAVALSGKTFEIRPLGASESAKPRPLHADQTSHKSSPSVFQTSTSAKVLPNAYEKPTEETDFMPVEWEEPFLDIMEQEGQCMRERNARLIEFATVRAVGVPSVQEECLRHLAYGLNSDQKDEFYNLAVSSSIPLALRKRFLGWVLDMGRNDEFVIWLCRSLRSHGNADLVAFAKSRIENFDNL
jgi:hypothetical protein